MLALKLGLRHAYKVPGRQPAGMPCKHFYYCRCSWEACEHSVHWQLGRGSAGPGSGPADCVGVPSSSLCGGPAALEGPPRCSSSRPLCPPVWYVVSCCHCSAALSGLRGYPLKSPNRSSFLTSRLVVTLQMEFVPFSHPLEDTTSSVSIFSIN